MDENGSPTLRTLRKNISQDFTRTTVGKKTLRFGVLGGRRESKKDLKKPFFSPQNAHVVEMQFVVFLYTPELTTTARP